MFLKLSILAGILLLPLSMFAQIPSNVPTAGLVGWFPFNGNANNESGIGNNGTVNGATLTTDRFGVADKAYSFNGITSYIEIPNYSAINFPQGTVSCWLKSSNNTTNYQQVIKKNKYFGADKEHFSLGINPSAYFGVMRNSTCTVNTGSFQMLWGSHNVANGNWHMVTASFDATSIRIYVDSVLVDTLASVAASASDTCAGDLLFGINWSNHKVAFNGALDEVGLWNRRLSQQEIAVLYAGCTAAVTTQPANVSVQAGAAANFTAGSNGSQATYQWQVLNGTQYQNLTNASPYTGVNSAMLTVSPTTTALNGKKYRCLINAQSCNFTSNTATLTVSPSASISAPAGLGELVLYPNPTNDRLLLDGPVSSGTIIVYSVDGRLQLRQPLDASKELRTADLPAGSYILQLLGAEAVRIAHFTVAR